jgi:hypothetical protein
MPAWQVLVCYARADIEHEDGALGTGVEVIAQAAHSLTLTDGAPDVKADLAIVLRCCQGLAGFF